MKGNKSHNILSILFVPYVFIFTFFFVLISSFFIFIHYTTIKQDAFAAIENNLTMINNTLDTQVEVLDTLSQNIIYSNLVKDTFATYLHYETQLQNPSDIETYNNIQNNRILYNLLFSIIGPNQPADQVYLYGMNGGSFGVGTDNFSNEALVSEKAWYNEVLNLEGSKYIFVEKNDKLSPYFTEDDGKYFLSLIRIYYDIYNTPQGFVEVKKNFSDISSILDALNYPTAQTIYIYNQKGELIYPFDNTREAINCYRQIEENISASAAVKMEDTKPSYIFHQTSPSSGFTTAISIDQNRLMASARQFIKTSGVVLLLVCITVMVVSYIIARRISHPITNIYGQVQRFRLDNKDVSKIEFSPLHINITELRVLYDALIKMQNQARDAMHRELQLQQRETQAKIIALEARMNPHFLYNSLSVIQALSDEQKNSTINIFCQNISNILRYISSDSEQLVSLKKELKYTEYYLQCMSIRYDDDLTYRIEIPDDMYELCVPKLCLQLLAENAIKYSTKKRGPWEIVICGQMVKNHWEIQVIDNGPGFTKEAVETLNRRIEEIQKSEVFPNLEINGMGLMNTYIRFKILYKEKQIFKFGNKEPNGAVITIGGPL